MNLARKSLRQKRRWVVVAGFVPVLALHPYRTDKQATVYRIRQREESEFFKALYRILIKQGQNQTKIRVFGSYHSKSCD